MGYVLLGVAVVFYGLAALQIRAGVIFRLPAPLLRNAQPLLFWGLIIGELIVATGLVWAGVKLLVTPGPFQ
jgi:hypothetical protein